MTGALEVVLWWELRRIIFNAVVGVAGAVSLIAATNVGLLAERLGAVPLEMPDPPILLVLPIILYGVAANALYTGGWVAELAVRRVWPAESDSFATIAFSIGLVGSALLTLAPGAVVLGVGFVWMGVALVAR